VEAYEATRQRHVEHLLPQIGEHFERVSWSAERLRAERTARLRELVGIGSRALFLASRSARDVDLTTLDEDVLRACR
jgi:hypothetical protein